MPNWECRISMYRNGRRVEFNDAMGDNPKDALYTAMNDLMRWAEDHPDSAPEGTPHE